MSTYHITEHVRQEMARRIISEDIVNAVMTSPEQILDTHSGRKIYQSKVSFGDKLYLIRVVVEERDPTAVITVYRTSKVDKYWRNDESSL